MARLAALDVAPSIRLAWEDSLRSRSLALFDRAAADIDPRAGWHAEVVGLMERARRDMESPVTGF